MALMMKIPALVSVVVEVVEEQHLHFDLDERKNRQMACLGRGRPLEQQESPRQSMNSWPTSKNN
jgi:hypothetical protein